MRRGIFEDRLLKVLEDGLRERYEVDVPQDVLEAAVRDAFACAARILGQQALDTTSGGK